MKKHFNKLLRELDEEELREELAMLYDRFPTVKEYYRMELSGSTKTVVDKYKKTLRKTFFTGRRRINRRGRSESKKVLKEFAQVSIHSRDLVELYFYRAEVMVEAVDYYTIDNDSFLMATVKAFEEAMRFAEKEVMLETYKEQIIRLVDYFDGLRRSSYRFRPVYDQYFGS